jgi:hypothetical protein
MPERVPRSNAAALGSALLSLLLIPTCQPLPPLAMGCALRERGQIDTLVVR